MATWAGDTPYHLSRRGKWINFAPVRTTKITGDPRMTYIFGIYVEARPQTRISESFQYFK